MIIEIEEKFQKQKISTAENVYEILLSAFNALDEIDQAKEHFFVLGLKRNNRPLYLDLVSVGTLSGTLVHAREVFRRAIGFSTHSIIVAHNHPSGSLDPSTADDSMTNSLKEAGKIIGIPITDHLIFSPEGFLSYANEGKL
jgi:DNA repair protein RadC